MGALVFEGPVAACLTNEVLEQVMIHVCKSLGLSDSRKMVDTKLEAELLQVLKTKRAMWWVLRSMSD